MPDEPEEEEVHLVQLYIQDATEEGTRHWPGKACFCGPGEVEVNAPCGHLVVVLVHGQDITPTLKDQIRSDVMSHYRKHKRRDDA